MRKDGRECCAADDYHSNPKFVAAMKEAKQLEGERRIRDRRLQEGEQDRGGHVWSAGGAVSRADDGWELQGCGGNGDADGGMAATPRRRRRLSRSRAGAAGAGRGQAKAGAAGGGASGVPGGDRRCIRRTWRRCTRWAGAGEDGQDGRGAEELSGVPERVSPRPGASAREHFAENPELSTHKMAPAFTVTALDGSKFKLDEMGGRVVLIDFWATWCGPCNEELPQMKKIAKEFAGQPLVIISVSWDRMRRSGRSSSRRKR